MYVHRRLSLLLIFAPLSTTGALAQSEPWGGNVPGWRFTQTPEANVGVNCRAFNGSNLIALLSNGRTYVSVPAPANLPQGWYRDGRATIVIGAAAEPVDAQQAPGQRLLFHIDTGLYTALARARGYQWRVAGPQGQVSGSVTFSGDVAKAIAELRACVRANAVTATPQPPQQPAPRNLKWSGNWNWARPLTIFGKPAYTKALSIELLPQNRIKLCVDVPRPDSCSVVPFTQQGNLYTFSPRGSTQYEVTVINGALHGKMWWENEDPSRMPPAGTFVLR